MFLAANWQTYTAYPVLCPFFVLALYVMHSKKKSHGQKPQPIVLPSKNAPKRQNNRKETKMPSGSARTRPKRKAAKKKYAKTIRNLILFLPTLACIKSVLLFFFKVAFLHLVVLIEHACYWKYKNVSRCSTMFFAFLKSIKNVFCVKTSCFIGTYSF